MSLPGNEVKEAAPAREFSLLLQLGRLDCRGMNCETPHRGVSTTGLKNLSAKPYFGSGAEAFPELVGATRAMPFVLFLLVAGVLVISALMLPLVLRMALPLLSPSAFRPGGFRWAGLTRITLHVGRRVAPVRRPLIPRLHRSATRHLPVRRCFLWSIPHRAPLNGCRRRPPDLSAASHFVRRFIIWCSCARCPHSAAAPELARPGCSGNSRTAAILASPLRTVSPGPPVLLNLLVDGSEAPATFRRQFR